jgi:hypothetical protein
MSKYCKSCGKLQTEIEWLVGQCNDCDPFEDPDALEGIYGEPQYKEVE